MSHEQPGCPTVTLHSRNRTVARLWKNAQEEVQRVISDDVSASELMRMARGLFQQALLLEGKETLRKALQLSILYRCAAYVLAFTDSDEIKKGPLRLKHSLVNDFIRFAQVCTTCCSITILC